MITYSIIQKSQLESTTRLDAEYYQPKYIQNAKTIEKYGFDTLEKLSIINITKGETPLWRGDEYVAKGIPFIRSENLIPACLDLSNLVFISGEVHERMKRSKIYPNDVLLAIVGATIGKTGLVTDDYPEYNSNQAIAIVRPSNRQLAYYLSLILETELCQLQIERLKGGGSRDNLDLHEVKILKIPKPADQLLDYCVKVISKVRDLLKESKTLYMQAENLLLEELRLKDFKPEEDLSYIVNLSDVKTAHRVDAEYFQPKYEKIIEKIKNQNVKLLGDLVSLRKGFEPGSDEYQNEGKIFIRVSNISKHGLIDKDQKYLSEELYQTLRKDIKPKTGEILLTKDATPGIAYVLKESIEGIIAGGILRLILKEDIEPEYLALCINSIVGQMQIAQDSGGSVIAHWKPEEIKNLRVPVIIKPAQKNIADFVFQSHQSRKKAKELLEQAKREVEQFIEKR